MKKFIVVIMGLIITAGIVCGFGFVSRRDGKWFQEPDISKWHIKNENSEDSTGGTDEPGNNEYPDDIEGDGEITAYASDGRVMRTNGLYAMPETMVILPGATASEKRFTLTAQLSNEYINAEYDWAADWVNPNSDWASSEDVNEYIRITPTYDGSASADVTFSGSANSEFNRFGEQIRITVRVRNSVTIQPAVCTVDCLRNVTINKAERPVSDIDDELTFTAQLDLNVGTIVGDISIVKFNISLNNGYLSELSRYLKFNIEPLRKEVPEENITARYEAGSNNFYADCRFNYADFIAGYNEYDEAHKDAIKYAWYHAYLSFKASHTNYDVFTCEYNIELKQELYGNRIDLSGSLKRNGYFSLTGEKYGKGITPNVQLNITDVIV